MTIEIHGSNDPRFEPVRAAFAQNFEQGLEVGASVAVTVDGSPVVDLWAGQATEGGDAWASDTIVNVWSTTKTMAGTCMLMLADRGELDFDAKVKDYWPEFAANGKAGVLVRNIMGHTSGLSGWAEPLDGSDLFDWEKCTSELAAQEPFWEPGDGSGYHAITLGYLQGEILRRITGQTMGEFFAKEVSGPLGADFHIGLDASHEDRVGTLIPPDGPLGTEAIQEGSIAYRTLANPRIDATITQERQWRAAEIPAANGHSNARAVSRIHSALACGGEVDGVRLIDESTLDQVFRVQAEGIDKVLGQPLTMGMGFGLSSELVPLSPSKRVFYWGGWGGSLAMIDLDQRMTISYVMNRMDSDSLTDLRKVAIVMAAYSSLS